MFDVAVDTRIHPQDGMARSLVVEAEPLVAIVLESALTDLGYQVLGLVKILKAATYLAATKHIDAAVVDTNIGGQIAEVVADKLIERAIPIVFIIGRSRMFSLHYSAIPRLQKPFTIDDLYRAITRLGSSRLLRNVPKCDQISAA
jgi:DNA-binding response OmpR family regulator